MNAETKVKAGGLSTALVKALAEIGGAAKDKVNPHFKSKYADIGSVIDAIKPILAAHDLGFTQHSQPSETGVIVETVLHHSGGDSLSMGTLYVPANKQDAQGFGSALTYARRYSLMTAFGVPAEDDDGNAAREATHRPTTGETPPAKRVPLDGPYTSKTALWAAAKAFDHAIRGMSDLGELLAYLDIPDSKAFIAQCKRDAPGLWSEGLDDIPEWVPLETVVANAKRDFEQNEDINKFRTTIDAG